jgi:YVTN family beta-propeller protein
VRGTVLCPSVLPRATLSWIGFPPPAIHASPWGGKLEPGLDIGYGAPWEPGAQGWRAHLWRNHVCCFLHFDVYRRPAGRRTIPSTARPAMLGGRHGLLKAAAGYGLACRGDAYLYWCNHAAFLWREDGVPYVASLHNFGRGTVPLLGRLVAGLRPARQIRQARRRGVAVGVTPNGIAVAGNNVWVAALGDRTGNFRGTILRLAAKTGRVLSRWHPARGPTGLVVADGTLWTVTFKGVARIDPRTGRRVALIQTGRFPRAVGVGAGAVWAVNSAPFSGSGRGSVVRIDPATNRVSDVLRLGRAPVTLAATHKGIWIADELDDTLTRVDPSGPRVIARIRVGRGPTSVTAAAGSIWVANTGSGTVSRVDPATNRVIATIRAGRAPRSIFAARTAAWVVSSGDGTVRRIDPKTNRSVVVVQGLGDPLAARLSGGSLWITTNSEGRLLRVRLGSREGR